MIATVILGIGLVMVATIFPVAVEQTREAVQISIIQKVAASAEQTLRLRMQPTDGTMGAGWGTSDLPGDRPYPSDDPDDPGYPFNDNDATDASTSDEPTAPSNYDTDPSTVGWQREATKHPRSFRVIRVANMVHVPHDQDNIEYLLPSPDGSLYDPFTEVMLLNVGPDAIFPGVYSQFLVLGSPEPVYADLSPRALPFNINLRGPPFDQLAGTFPRIDIVDRVYPPVGPRLPHRPLNNDNAYDHPRFQDLQEAATRRYCWAALGAAGLGSTGPEGSPYQVRILVMYREDLTARYASQHGLFGVPTRHGEPKALSAGDDTLFPRLWLVKFDDGNPATFPDTNYTAAPLLAGGGATLAAGTVVCHWRVGDLLPPGAIFVDFERGKAHTVLQNVPHPTNPDYRRLLVVPDPDLVLPEEYADTLPPLQGMYYWYPDFPDYAWVVPPPIVRTGTGNTDYFFEGKCPVLAVFESTIPRRGAR